jgi:hypothetical protein
MWQSHAVKPMENGFQFLRRQIPKPRPGGSAAKLRGKLPAGESAQRPGAEL